MTARGTLLAALLSLLTAAAPLVAVSTWGDWSYEARVLAEETGGGDLFGSAVALSGSTLVVGAVEASGGDGAVYVFERHLGGAAAWGEATVLRSPQADAAFGQAVAVDEDLLAVGSIEAEAVWVYERSPLDPAVWDRVARLEPVGDPNSHFGLALAIVGATVVVGAPQADPDGLYNAGGVYVFERLEPAGWEAVFLAAPDAAERDGFGRSLAFDGSTLAVGAYLADVDGVQDSGAAYVFDRDGSGGWSSGVELAAAEPGEDHRLGSSIGLDGDDVLVGAPRAGDNREAIEGLYVFSRRGGEWIEAARLPGEGEVLSVAAGRAAIDAVAETISVYERATVGWTRTARLVGERGYGGAVVALEGDLLALGDPFDHRRGFQAGAAYVYRSFDLTLVAAGSCPGRLRLELQDVQPGARVALASSLRADPAPAGAGCPETLIYLGEPVWLGTGRADGEGRLVLDRPVTDSGCDRLFQAIDLTTCRTSNVATLARSSHVELAKLDSGAENFGSAVAFDGRRAVIGACCFPPVDVAYVYAADPRDPRDWHLESELLPVGDYVDFGNDVALSGGAAAVADSLGDAVHVFERDAGVDGAWGHLARLEAYGSDDTSFASSVAMSGGLLAVGAAYQTGAAPRTGAVYLYRRVVDDAVGWVPTARLWVEEGESGDAFGGDLAVDGDTLVVGAREATGVEARTGVAYVFARDIREGWERVATLLAPDGEIGDKFGDVVAIDGDTVVVGADWTADEAGAAYVYQREATVRGGWRLVEKLQPREVFHQENFGLAVGIAGDTVLVASHPPEATGVTGTVYVFQRNYGGLDAWGQVDRIVPSDGVHFEEFGEALAASGELLLVGAPRDGGAYVYRQKPPRAGRP